MEGLRSVHGVTPRILTTFRSVEVPRNDPEAGREEGAGVDAFGAGDIRRALKGSNGIARHLWVWVLAQPFINPFIRDCRLLSSLCAGAGAARVHFFEGCQHHGRSSRRVP